jgi:hypothetical protein
MTKAETQQQTLLRKYKKVTIAPVTPLYTRKPIVGENETMEEVYQLMELQGITGRVHHKIVDPIAKFWFDDIMLYNSIVTSSTHISNMWAEFSSNAIQHIVQNRPKDG